MINLGYKEPDYSGECISESKPKKMKTAYPVLCIRDAELPFESSDVGKEFTITAKISLKEVSKREVTEANGRDEKKQSYDLEFLSLDIQGKKAKKDDPEMKDMEDRVEGKKKKGDESPFFKDE